MRLRLDLLEQMTEQDLLEEVLANNPRYKPEPRFQKLELGACCRPQPSSVRKRKRAARP